ncbi:hypothetical protein FDK12_14530 [Arthrobacter sp. NamB2]|uniref:DUF5655 domain-containing protein n=1 Tax=Arthrobacter sp. NamB2 TaxID=2576035 RepID=UPI0010C9F36A|nr:DUF5655 domain-containing protein [Arthrobacter sp. NamB2]TKV25889.1 hypothetical protein FDK12_14530 [Arthrobacter sp. NamB2]
MGEMQSWQPMLDANAERLLRTTGRTAAEWAAEARASGIIGREELSRWLRSRGVTGYNLMSVDWEVFGIPEFFLHSADERYAGQYSDRQALKPIADRILLWAAETPGVVIQMRKNYVSLQTPRRKFAQLTPTTKTAVDLHFRLAVPNLATLEALRATNDPFAWRVRLRHEDDVDDALIGALSVALEDSRERSSA